MEKTKFNPIQDLKFLICLLLAGSGLVDALRHIPEPFSEKKLPSNQRGGQYVENLGHVLSLVPLFSAPETVDPYGTKLIIYNRDLEEPTEMEFSPNRFCHHECHGPFQYDLVKMEESRINASRKTVFIISGYLSGEKIKWMESIKDDWLEMEDVNVVLVTWRDSNRYRYEFAAGATTMVARQVTIFLHYFAELQGLSLLDDRFTDTIHFVGHSLGAHIAGFVGQDLGGKMGHITGLDPSGPGFSGVPVGRRLDKSDAKLVDVIHTNAGEMAGYTQLMMACMSDVANSLIYPHIDQRSDACTQRLESPSGAWKSAWFGTNSSCGHLDFYPNGGSEQPGCTGELHRCDHGRSHELFADLLRLEISRRQLNGNFLRAFRAADYESFISGASMHLHCDNLDGCSLPIDFFSPVDRIKQNLKANNSLDLDKTDEVKLYLRTNAERPFINDHYLLSLRLREPMSWSKDQCELKMTVRMLDGRRLLIGTLKKLDVTKDPDDDSFIMALPFVGLIGGQKIANLAVHEHDKVRQALPKEIELAIDITKKSVKFIDSIKSNISWIFGFGGLEGRCLLNVVSVEIRPMISLGQHSNKRLIARYSDSNRVLEESLVLNSNEVTKSTEQLVSWRFD